MNARNLTTSISFLYRYYYVELYTIVQCITGQIISKRRESEKNIVDLCRQQKMFSISWLWESNIFTMHAGLIHRHLKPENVLIWESPANNHQVLMKWADFGLSKRVNERGSHSISGVKGTYDWIAPELLQWLDDGDEIHQFENEARKRGTIKSARCL